MCTCNQKNKDAAAIFLKQKHGDKVKLGTLVSLVNQSALKTENKLIAIGYDEYELRGHPVKKDGTLGKSKQYRVPMVHSYCPHCGEKLAP